MTIAVDALAVIRSWVGSAVGRPGDLYDNDDLESRYGTLGTGEAVALQILQERRANIALGNPAQWSVDGDHSENWSKNLDVLDAQIAKLERIVGSATVSVSSLVRERPSR